MIGWRVLLAYIAGTINEELRLRNEYLAAENRVLRAQIRGRPRLRDEEKRTLAEVGKRLGRRLLASVAAIVTPDTILRWHREMIARKFDGSKQRGRRGKQGRPPVPREVRKLVIRFARENRTWGYDRIVGVLANLGHQVSATSVAEILKKAGLPPAPERTKETTWREFIRRHMKVLCATDFFTAEVWTARGLVTYYVLFFIHLGTRRVHIAGMTPNPNAAWMAQIARNETMADSGFLTNVGCQYLLHDRAGEYCPAFDNVLESAAIEPIRLPPQSPNLNAFAERWVRSVKEECVDKYVLFGEAMLRRVIEEYVEHYHSERNHQGVGNELLFPDPPAPTVAPESVGRPIRCRERLGGLLKYYYRTAG